MQHEVAVGETITVAELAQKMAVKSSEVMKTMLNMGVIATINQPVDQDTAVLVIVIARSPSCAGTGQAPSY